MPANIVEAPFTFDFANNALSFRLSGTPVAVTGRKAESRYKINTMPRANYYLELTFGTKRLVFYFRNTTSAINEPYAIYLYSSAADRQNELLKKIGQNYYVAKYYSVTVLNTLEIRFTSRQNGGENVTLQTNDSAANIQFLSQTTGIEKVDKVGYKLFAKLEVTHCAAGITKTVHTPEILLHVSANNRASLPLALLRSYFQEVDTPSLSQKLAVYKLKYAMIKCCLVYSDYFEDTVQMIKFSNEYHLVNGKLSEAHRAANLPDWNCPMGGSNKLSSFARPRSYGSPSALTVKSYMDLPQYAYFMLFNPNASTASTSTLQVRIDIRNENGTTKNNINPGALVITNFSIVRIPLSVKVLSLENHSTQILHYTVRIYHTAAPAAVWTRTFVLQEKPFYAKEFLLQNKYGVLESFFIENEMVEKTVDGEKVTSDGKVEIDVQDIFTTFTARTGYKSDFEMKLLSEALENRFHYKIVNGSLLPITILPDTLTIFDEGEDLQSAEFQYTFKIPDRSLPSPTVNMSSGTFEKEVFENTWNEPLYQVWNDRFTFEEKENTTLIAET
ncbi:MAG: hypothetical protein FWD09_08235 [Lentimicrobiaceae bacterium]|nr:hypothetical protein [Lentimicrobiaceae bacterium]